MSLYNLLNGVNQSAFFFLPMLGKHPDEYPRFRDCFLRDPDHPKYDNHIHVYTRTGGGNRDEYKDQNEAMRQMDGFVTDHDDSFDSTFATWVFVVPDRWRADFDNMLSGNLKLISAEYRAEMARVYPKLADKFREIFEAIEAQS
jgi:hypothetical protein